MPAGDITHPVPDLTGYITEGQLVLSHEPHARGVYPPFEPLRSLSRLMRLGAGPGRTRDDHLEVAAQLYALAAEAQHTADLADVVGEDALGDADRAYLAFGAAFETEFVSQGRPDTNARRDARPRRGGSSSTLSAARALDDLRTDARRTLRGGDRCAAPAAG